MPAANLNIGDWDVESLRVTIFHPLSVRVADRTGLWEEVVGDPPNSIDSRPRDQLTRVTGNTQKGNLLLLIRDTRIDWQIQPLAPPFQQTSRASTSIDPADMLSVITHAVQLSLQTVSVVGRFAFAPVLFREVPDVPTGLQQLSHYLPHLTLDAEGSADFIYQINRKRRSAAIRRRDINRLARWSVEEIGSLALRVVAGQPNIYGDSGTHFARKLVLDINTTPQTSAIANDKISGLFDEMVNMSSELATRGDVP